MITSVLAVAQKNGERHDCPQSVGKVDVLGRLRYDPRTRAYAERRTHEGLSKPEIIRCLIGEVSVMRPGIGLDRGFSVVSGDGLVAEPL